MPQSQFKELFCQRFRCPPERFGERASCKLLYPHARFIAPILRLFGPGLFTEDLKFIEYLGNSRGFRDATVDVMNFNDVNRSQHGLLRGTFRLRVSGRRATKLAKELFGVRRTPLEHRESS